jgi:hypothetical protein
MVEAWLAELSEEVIVPAGRSELRDELRLSTALGAHEGQSQPNAHAEPRKVVTDGARLAAPGSRHQGSQRQCGERLRGAQRIRRWMLDATCRYAKSWTQACSPIEPSLGKSPHHETHPHRADLKSPDAYRTNRKLISQCRMSRGRTMAS